ncbi:MAG TPA: hypothetical protein VGQ86_08915 [Candidatus Limnocylindria bacterium]|nr:hypothetical protein [Candidatus Limnocylindria bacterium]
MRRAKGLAVLAAGLALLFQAGAIVALADDPKGNNGDVKIHEVGTAVDDHRNEPHVCSFYIDGFNFDAASKGTWRIELWAPSGSGAVKSGEWGEADAKGNWHSGTISGLADGHYKLFFKQTVPMTPGGDKQKVFWVECAAPNAPAGNAPSGNAPAGNAPESNAPAGNAPASNAPQAVGGVETSPAPAAAVMPQAPAQGPAAQGGAQNNAQMGVVGGVQSLPSTSTEAGIPLAGLGAVLMTLGAYLLQRPVRQTD